MKLDRMANARAERCTGRYPLQANEQQHEEIWRQYHCFMSRKQAWVNPNGHVLAVLYRLAETMLNIGLSRCVLLSWLIEPRSMPLLTILKYNEQLPASP